MQSASPHQPTYHATGHNAIDMVSRFGIDAAPAALVAEKGAALDAYLTASAFPLMPGARDPCSCFTGAV
jgi:hypothetical protein